MEECVLDSGVLRAMAPELGGGAAQKSDEAAQASFIVGISPLSSEASRWRGNWGSKNVDFRLT